MTRISLIGATIAFVLFADVAIAADAGKENAALIVAEKWLTLVDEGEYADSWTEAAFYFKAEVTQKTWEQKLHAVRGPLGKVVSRKIITETYRTSLPGAPDGEYVVIRFETSFQHRKSAVERVTPVLDKDGQWRVAGYFINAGSPDQRQFLKMEKKKAAVAAAEKWLALVDEGNYADSWREASEKLQAAIIQKTWEQLLHSDREPEGNITSRKVKNSTYQSTLPDNEDVVIWYETSFQKMQSAVERVWTRLDEDGQWRVTGYVITAGSPDLRSILMALLLFLVIISVWLMELKPKRDAAEQ